MLPGNRQCWSFFPGDKFDELIQTGLLAWLDRLPDPWEDEILLRDGDKYQISQRKKSNSASWSHSFAPSFFPSFSIVTHNLRSWNDFVPRSFSIIKLTYRASCVRTLPDRTFYNFRASKSGHARALYRSKKSFDGLGSSKTMKCFVGQSTHNRYIT